MKKLGLILTIALIALLLVSCSEKEKGTYISDETYEAMTEEQKTFISDDFKCYMYNPGVLEIMDYTGNAEVLELPSELFDMPVKTIGGTFSYNKKLKTVTIPKSIQYISGTSILL